MLLIELFEDKDKETEEITEGAKIAYARQGGAVVRKYRCTSGPRQGRIVNRPIDCTKPFDLKKRQKIRQTKLAKGKFMQRKRVRTMRRDPASLRVQKLNKPARAS